AAVLLCTSLTVAVVVACGPELTSAFLLRSREILRAPEHWLGFQIRSVKHPPKPPANLAPTASGQELWQQRLHSTLEVDVGDLRQALTEANVPSETAASVVEDYQRQRFLQLSQWEDAENRTLPDKKVLVQLKLGLPTTGRHPWLVEEDWPKVVPSEFRLYSKGVEHMHSEQWDDAKASWKGLLALPFNQRRYRSSWAAWMLYKTAANRTDAIHWLEQVCDLVQREGCADSLRMHPAALSLLSKIRKEAASPATLALHYFNTKANERTVYSETLQSNARAIVANPDPEVMDQAVRDPASREIITLVLAHDTDGCMPDPAEPPVAEEEGNKALQAWAAALGKAGVTNDPVLGEFAIALYRKQQYALARKFINCGAITWETQWIRAKLDLQRGDKAAAARHMAHALRRFPLDEKQTIVSITESYYERNRNSAPPQDDYRRGLRNSRFLADNASIRLGIGDFATALKLFLDADCPHDAAFVAEQIMTPDELLSFIRDHRLKYTPAGPEPPRDDDRYWRREYLHVLPEYRSATNAFLYIAARKLARERWFKDARPLMPPEFQPLFDRYVTLYRNGHSSVLKPEVRARCVMEAARIHRWQGMELFGAEGEPDGAVWSGNYDFYPLSLLRERMYRKSKVSYMLSGAEEMSVTGRWLAEITTQPPVLSPSDEELARLRRNILWAKPRFHYRYEAAELAWQAAHLLPKESNEAASMLGEAGTWLASEQADRFYKEMIWKHWSTPVAREADKKRWFPSVLRKRYDIAELLARPVPGQ
ncbi:MAG: hypothetical protein JWO08_2886, partial [Verrucomicrobiaceae bacterium]|nr:hypothetical protein [Verrucomicrobiaceae bacterium]